MEIFNVDYHITDICNLNCVSCNHFCPLVPHTEKHKKIEQIKADLLLLSKFKESVKILSIMGGEPTLHPDLVEILDFSRQVLPYSEIHLVTNGTTYKMFKNWQEAIKRNHVLVVVSQYPYKPDYKESYAFLKNLLQENYAASRYDEFTLRMQTAPLSNDVVSTNDGILNCRMRKGCTQLANGKLYICNYAANFNRLKAYFNDEIKIEQDNNDYVDLNVCTESDIEDLIYNRCPKICYYCRECQRWDDLNMEWVDWKRSERKIEEWVK